MHRNIGANHALNFFLDNQIRQWHFFRQVMRVETKISLAMAKQLGDNIRRERVAKQISQQPFAEPAGLNIRSLQRIEAGEVDVLLTIVVRISKALNCPLERLVPKN